LNSHQQAGLIATASLDKTVLLWDPELAGAGPVAKLEGHADTVCSVAPAADGHLLTASWDGTVKLWSLGSSQCVT
jgi:WD40 repeat protein